MRIALSEGRLSRWEELLHEMTPRQLTTLQAYSRIEPWGDERADLREAVMAASVASAMSVQPVGATRFAEQVRALARYLGEPESDKPLSPNEGAKMARSLMPDRG